MNLPPPSTAAAPPIRVLLGLGCLVLSLSTPATAQNLVTNGELHLDVDGWTVTSPSISDLEWNGFDATECGPLSGSARVSNYSIVASGSASFRYCVGGIVPGATYSFGGQLRFPTGQTQTGYATMLLNWMEQEDCLGSVLDVESTGESLESSDAGIWFTTSANAVVAPAGAQAARLAVLLVKDSPTGVLDLRFDGIFLVQEAGFLFSDDFELDSSCRWSSEAP